MNGFDLWKVNKPRLPLCELRNGGSPARKRSPDVVEASCDVGLRTADGRS